MNECGAGLQITPSSSLTLFYDVEGNRRNFPDWQYARYLGWRLPLIWER